jgi:hypothetical protein
VHVQFPPDIRDDSDQTVGLPAAQLANRASLAGSADCPMKPVAHPKSADTLPVIVPAVRILSNTYGLSCRINRRNQTWSLFERSSTIISTVIELA